MILPFLFVFAFSIVDAACPATYNLGPVDGKKGTYNWDQPHPTNAVDYAICGTGDAPCGVDPSLMCANKPNCCGSCQRWQDEDGSAQGVCLGVFDHVEVHGAIVSLVYTKGDNIPNPAGQRQVYINLTCVASTPAGTLIPKQFTQPSVEGHIPGTPYIYGILMETSAVCGGPGGGGGVYGGGWFLLILFLGFFIYFVVGVLYNKFSQNKEGRDLVPNVDFWTETPVYFIAGCQFTWAKITGLCGRGQYDTVS